MKNGSIQESLTRSKISIVSNVSIPEFPFQLTTHDYQEKIEFIKNTPHENSWFKESAADHEKISQREFNSNFASLQSWFMRISHKEKLSFVLELLNIFSVVLRNSTNLLIDILGPVPKDFIYAKTQFTLSKYDMTPLDNNRCLTDIPLAEAKSNSLFWFSELEEKEQVRVMIILLSLSGSAITFNFYFKAVKYLDRNCKYNSSVIEEKLNNYKFYSMMMNKEESNSVDLLIREVMSDTSPISFVDNRPTHVESYLSHMSHGSNPVSSAIPETKNIETSEKSASSSSKYELATMDYAHKLEEWENGFQELLNMSGILKVGKLNENALPVIDMLQLLPISVNRYIYSLLDQRSKKHLRLINKYWSKSGHAVYKEIQTRHWLGQTINLLELKLYKYKTKDLYSEVKYVQAKRQDKDQSLSDQEITSKRKPNSKQPPNSPSATSIKRSESAPSLMDIDSFSPKYSIKMIPDPNHHYPDIYPKNPYDGRYIISEICSRFDHTRCIAANYQWIALSDKYNITLHSLLTGAPNPRQLEGHTGYVTALYFHPSKACLFSGSCDTTIKYWDIYSRRIITTYSKHKSLIIDMSVNENHLASVSMDQTLRIFDIDSGYMIWKYLFSCNPVVVDLGRKLEVYLGVEDGSVFKTDLESTTTPIEWEIIHAHGEKVTCIIFDEPFVVSGGEDGFVRVWHFEHFDASALATFDHNGVCVTGVGLSFMKVITTTIDGILRIWDIYNSKLTRQILVNIAKTPIISIICMEIYDHIKIIINNEDGIKVIEFPFYWINFSRACKIRGDKEPRFMRGTKRIITTTPGDVLASETQLRMISKQKLEKRCRERLLLRNSTVPDVVNPMKGDKVTLKEVSIFSKSHPDNGLLLFPRIIPGTQKMIPYTVKREILGTGSKVLNTLWKYLPRSTKGVLPGYNPSKKTI